MENPKLFVGWSGTVSLGIGKCLSEFLQYAVPRSAPWISEDINKGSLWLGELGDALKDCKAGLFVVTKENLSNPWLHFEAGAISQAVGAKPCCPILAGLEPKELSSPLSDLQATPIDSEHKMKELVFQLNGLCSGDQMLSETQQNKLFSKFWPDLVGGVATELAKSTVTKDTPSKSKEEVLAEILDRTRSIDRRVGAMERSSPRTDADNTVPPARPGMTVKSVNDRKRVHILAKELNVTSKDIVTKCREEGIESVMNHMSLLSPGLEATIVEWFT